MKFLLPKFANILKKDRNEAAANAAGAAKESDPVLCGIARNIRAMQTEETAFELRRRLYRESQAGEVSAMVLYGQMLMRGEGGARDEMEARHWFGEAANRKNPQAMFFYGKALLEACGGPRDEKKGLAWIEKAAHMGCHEAAMLLNERN